MEERGGTKKNEGKLRRRRMLAEREIVRKTDRATKRGKGYGGRNKSKKKTRRMEIMERERLCL